jgi:hypothetical protein
MKTAMLEGARMGRESGNDSACRRSTARSMPHLSVLVGIGALALSLVTTGCGGRSGTASTTSPAASGTTAHPADSPTETTRVQRDATEDATSVDRTTPEAESARDGGDHSDSRSYVTTLIQSYELLQGQPEWADRYMQRLAHARWEFNEDGMFVFAPYWPDSHFYPLRGSYERSGDRYSFRASGSVTTGNTGTMSVEVIGAVDFSGDQPILTIDWISGSSSAMVVNGQRFGQTTGAHSRATLTVQEEGN